PKKKVDVSADITGRITKIAVREGDFVKQGQFLIQIDPTVYEANLQQATATMASSQAAAVQAKATRDQADRALGRTKELHTQNPNLLSQEQLEQAQTAFDVAEANLTAAPHQVNHARAAVQPARASGGWRSSPTRACVPRPRPPPVRTTGPWITRSKSRWTSRPPTSGRISRPPRES